MYASLTVSSALEVTSHTDEPRGYFAQSAETCGNARPEYPQASDAQPLVPSPPPVTLSDEQEEVLQMVMSGQNVFFTGSAGSLFPIPGPQTLTHVLPLQRSLGTGKSVLLREIISHCRALYSSSNELAITAATGIAGVNIGGCTLHSWAGIGLGKEDAEFLVGKLLGQFKNRRKRAGLGAAVARWMDVKTLIVDESKCLISDWKPGSNVFSTSIHDRRCLI